MLLLQQEFKENRISEKLTFQKKDFYSDSFKNDYSEYMMGGIKDQLSFYYNDEDYDLFLRFFSLLEGNIEFNYKV